MELLQKLRIEITSPLWVIDPPTGLDLLLPGADIRTRIGRKQVLPQVMLFAIDSIAMNKGLSMLEGYIGPETLFWICYPKKTGSITSDLIRMEPWEVLTAAGFRGQTSVSVNEDWTGMRFTNAPRKKPSACELPMEQRTTEGIDYVNRKVQLPPDALAVLAQFPGTAEIFAGMSFTHQREHMEAIAGSKKPETRARRIDKMAEMLLGKRKH